MGYRSASKMYARAKQNTEFKCRREILTAILMGLAYWYFFPRVQFLEEGVKLVLAAFVGAFIMPGIEFACNFLVAPLRLADERIAELEIQLSQYKVTQSEQEITLGYDRVVKGRWYGQRFVFDEPIYDFMTLVPSSDKKTRFPVTLSCRPNSLGHFHYIVSGNASVCVRTPGTVAGRILDKKGELEMTLNEKSALEFEVESKNKGIDTSIRWWTFGWTEAMKIVR